MKSAALKKNYTPSKVIEMEKKDENENASLARMKDILLH